MSDALARDPVFGEVARALQPRSLGRVDRRINALGWSTIEIAICSAAVRHDTFESSVNWGDATGERERHVLGRRDGPAGQTQVTFEEGQLATDAFFLPSAEAMYEAHVSRSRDHVAPQLMGVVNVTPDSFSDGGRFRDANAAIAHGLELERQGAHILDVGGESTRPGSDPVSVDEELRRTIPIVEELAKQSKARISIDTTKSAVARAALDAGATIVNDVSAGRFDDAVLPLVAERGATFIAMHMLGTPRDMQQDPQYGDVVSDVLEFLRERCYHALCAGIARDKLWIDPGIGFGKTLAHNLELLRRLPELRSLGLPIVLGVSRKSFIASIHPPAKEQTDRIGGTAAALTLGVLGGAEILRVHDVAIMAEAAAVAAAIATPRDDSAR